MLTDKQSEEGQSLLDDQNMSKQSIYKRPSKENLSQQILIIAIIAFYSESQRSYFTSFFPIFWKDKHPDIQSNGFPQWMINIPEISIFIFFSFQAYFLNFFGQKNYILLGLFLCFISNMVLSLINEIKDINLVQYVALQFRMFQGFGINMIQTASISMVCILFVKQRQQKMSMIQSAIGTGEVIGPYIGSQLFHLLGFFRQFYLVNMFVLIFSYIFYKKIPQKEHQDNIDISNFTLDHRKNINKNLFTNLSIFMDFFIMSVNIILDWCYIAHFSNQMMSRGLSSHQVGYLFLLRGITYIIACFIIPHLKLIPKMSHILGIALQCLSLFFKCSTDLVSNESDLRFIILGLILQASPLVMISVIPSIIERYQFVYNISNTDHAKCFMELCDSVSNITELMLSLFQVIGSFTGSHFTDCFGYSFTILGYIIFGLVSLIIYCFFGCGVNYRQEDKLIRQNVLINQ